MSINKQLIQKKLQFLDKHLSAIERMEFDEAGFTDNPDIHDLITFRLQQSIETCIDIASHILANIPEVKKESAKDAFLLLGTHQIISEELSLIMGKAADFRNRVVHGYNNFDYSLLFHDYKDDLINLRKFGEEIVRYLQSTV